MEDTTETVEIVIPYTLRPGAHAWECEAELPKRLDRWTYPAEAWVQYVAACPAAAFAGMAAEVARRCAPCEVPVFVRVRAGGEGR